MSAETGDSSESNNNHLHVNLSDAEKINRHLMPQKTDVALMNDGNNVTHEILGPEKAANYLNQALTQSSKTGSYGDLPDPSNLSWYPTEQPENPKISLLMSIDESDRPYTVGYSMMAPVEFRGDRYDLEFATSVMTGGPRTVQDIHDLSKSENTEVAEAYQAIIEELEEN